MTITVDATRSRCDTAARAPHVTVDGDHGHIETRSAADIIRKETSKASARVKLEGAGWNCAFPADLPAQILKA